MLFTAIAWTATEEVLVPLRGHSVCHCFLCERRSGVLGIGCSAKEFFTDALAMHLINRARAKYWSLMRMGAELRRTHATAGWGGVRTLAKRRIRHAALSLTGREESEETLIRDSMEYWNNGEHAGIDLKDFSHWRGAGPWKDAEKWLALGRPHFRLYEKLCLVTSTKRPVRRLVEWGCGGGANAVHFAREVEEYCGIEISSSSLDECAAVLAEAGFSAFRPVLISAEAPERALDLADGEHDVFICTYVFELLPGKLYGERVLRVAHGLLRPGGLAIIQIRYDDGSERSNQKKSNYFRHAARFTSYRIDEFWNLTARLGFDPEFVSLVPARTPEYSGDLYAYFALTRRR